MKTDTDKKREEKGAVFESKKKGKKIYHAGGFVEIEGGYFH